MATERDEDLETEEAEDQEKASQEPSEGQEPAKPKWSQEVEDIARSVGWTPKENYRGNPDQWRDPVEFLRTGKSTHQNLRAERDRDRQEFADTIRRTEKMAELALDKQRRSLEEQFKAQLRYAASQGDMEVYNAVEKNRDKALEDFDKETVPVKERKQGAQQPDIAPETVAFVERHSSWFNKDAVMTGAAVALCGDLQARFPSLPLSSVMNMVEESMKAEFPHRFNGSRKMEESRGPAKVEGGQRPIKTAVKKGWDQLPPEAKQAGKGFIDRGLFGSDVKAAQAAYAEQYWED